MKKARKMVAGMAVVMALVGVAGCQNGDKDKVDDADTAVKKAETAKPVASPAQQKPKDHPAH